MARYKRQETIYKLVFADPEMDGLEVRVRDVSIGKLRQLVTLREDASDDEQTEELDKLFNEFAKSLVDWNLDDENDDPVPATLEGILAQPGKFVMQIIGAWIETVSGVPKDGPLPVRSTGGSPFQVASIPVVPRSQSLSTLATQSG
jgi:hypothetical protein